MFVKKWKYIGKALKLMITSSFKSTIILTRGYLKRKPLQSNDNLISLKFAYSRAQT
jgi:hypothetical protein